MKKSNRFLASLAIVMALSGSVGSAWGYFTASTAASGGYPVVVGSDTEIKEDFSAGIKYITITNKEGSAPVYVRARAYCSSQVTVSYADESGKWTPGDDGYYYYSDVLEGGKDTAVLQVEIENIPKDAKDGDSFNVVVVYECTPVLYKDGAPYADWNQILNNADNAEGGA